MNTDQPTQESISAEAQAKLNQCKLEAKKLHKKAYQLQYKINNVEKIKTAQAEYYKKNVTRLKAVREAKAETIATYMRGYNLNRFYSLTLTQYDAMLAKQNGVCAICHKPEAIANKSLAVDHDHTTRAVRGLLCSACNQGLGLYKDNAALLRNAAAYLESQPTIV